MLASDALLLLSAGVYTQNLLSKGFCLIPIMVGNTIFCPQQKNNPVWQKDGRICGSVEGGVLC